QYEQAGARSFAAEVELAASGPPTSPTEGHEFIFPTLYHFPSNCEACTRPLWNVFKPPPALECRRCHTKCHKDHLDRKEEEDQQRWVGRLLKRVPRKHPSSSTSPSTAHPPGHPSMGEAAARSPPMLSPHGSPKGSPRLSPHRSAIRLPSKTGQQQPHTPPPPSTRKPRVLEFGLGDWSWSLEEVDSDDDEDDRFF
ncbi:hypothetical protein CRUP_032780, partial [Coryphaenoides rupestris]